MTKVKFLQSISTVDDSFQVNQIASIKPTLADSWIKAGVCESAEPAKTPAELKADKKAAEIQAAVDKKAADEAAAAKIRAEEDAQFERELKELEASEKKTAAEDLT